MNELFNISILAESENGFVEIIFFVVVALFGIIGSVVTNLKKKRQEQEEQQRIAELRDEARARNEGNDDEWPEKMRQMRIRDGLKPTPAPPVQAERPQKVAAIGDFVKSARRRLVPDQEVHRPEPVPVPVQLKSAAVVHPEIPTHSSHPPKIARHKAKRKSNRLATLRDHNDIHRTVPCEGVSASLYSQQSGTAIHLDAAAARQAIIFHEIFSPPKALRENCELWD